MLCIFTTDNANIMFLLGESYLLNRRASQNLAETTWNYPWYN